MRRTGHLQEEVTTIGVRQAKADWRNIQGQILYGQELQILFRAMRDDEKVSGEGIT